MPKIKLRFGEAQADESIPPLETLAEEVERNGIFGTTGNRRGVSMESEGEEYTIGDDYIYLRYVHEVTEERKEIDEGEVVIGEGNIARIMRFLLTQDGSYAYESTSGVYDDNALEYLIGDDSFEIDFQCNRYNRFTREQMKEFYEGAFRVRGLKLDEIGDRDEENTSIDSDVAGHVDRAGESVVRAEFSTGQQDNNLQGPPIVDGFARLSEVDYLRMKNAEGQINEAYQSGRYTISHPADIDLDQEGERVRDVLSSVTDGLAHEEDSD
ncbi:hypothetical protein [Halorubrum aethiopicum]|uniref:hypothetical protein n=1 Tax=Halorubrum aethiopicum TaxID=1758255 RepID=UPI0008338239|nr:hypothetical protein [Halorubrum aethiopicum]